MAVNVSVEGQEAQVAAEHRAQPQPVSPPRDQERGAGGALAPRQEWITPPGQQLVPIDRDLIAEIEEIAGKEAAAQAINDIVRRELSSRRLLTLARELAEESGGPLTAEERAWAESLLWPE